MPVFLLSVNQVDNRHFIVPRPAPTIAYRQAAMERASGLTAQRPKRYLYQITNVAKCCSENDFCRLAASGTRVRFDGSGPWQMLARSQDASESALTVQRFAPRTAGRIETRHVANRLGPAREIPAARHAPTNTNQGEFLQSDEGRLRDPLHSLVACPSVGRSEEWTAASPDNSKLPFRDVIQP